jgi:hypothetical protein
MMMTMMIRGAAVNQNETKNQIESKQTHNPHNAQTAAKSDS